MRRHPLAPGPGQDQPVAADHRHPGEGGGDVEAGGQHQDVEGMVAPVLHRHPSGVTVRIASVSSVTFGRVRAG